VSSSLTAGTNRTWITHTEFLSAPTTRHEFPWPERPRASTHFEKSKQMYLIATLLQSAQRSRIAPTDSRFGEAL
jgi:hypothetical protein